MKVTPLADFLNGVSARQEHPRRSDIAKWMPFTEVQVFFEASGEWPGYSPPARNH
jgi:hypothetical protein